MPITQDRLISLIVIADETLKRLEKIHQTVKSYVAIAKQTGAGDAPPHLLYQTLLDIDVLIQREKSLNLTAFEVLVRERTHFAINMRSNKRSKDAIKRLRQNLELDTNPFGGDETETTETESEESKYASPTKHQNLDSAAQLVWEAFRAFTANGTAELDSFGRPFLSSNQLAPVLESLEPDSNEQHLIINELWKQKYLVVGEYNGDWLINRDKFVL